MSLLMSYLLYVVVVIDVIAVVVIFVVVVVVFDVFVVFVVVIIVSAPVLLSPFVSSPSLWETHVRTYARTHSHGNRVTD